MTMTAIDAQASEDDRYESFLHLVRETFTKATSSGAKLFTTNAADLMQVYLDAAPIGQRQFRTCHACRQFIERFGGLVTIDADGNTHSAMWTIDNAPPMYRDAAKAIAKAVERAEVTGVFLSSEPRWGTPVTGKWTHFAVTPSAEILHRSVVTTAGQAMAEKLEERGMLLRGLAEFKAETVRHALALLENDSLYRAEKHRGIAKWLLDLHERRDATKNKRAKENITWLAVALAPVGWCHVKSGMIGTLLEDIEAGLPFEAVKRKFAEKMDPLQYMRPTAAPSAGQIAAAEKIVSALESSGALARRYARLSDIEALWTPKAAEQKKPAGGVFGHLLDTGNGKPLSTGASATTMTWTKFASTVLPSAERIEYAVPHSNENYCALVTAVDPEATPILQWDRLEARNPVSWYVYHGGSTAASFGLTPGLCDVTSVALQPSMWRGATLDHQGASVIFMLKGARDSRASRAGLGLFPEIMKSEYHAVRKTIELYSQRGRIQGGEEGESCGIRLQKGSNWSATFYVTARGVRTAYRLDRWD